MTTYYGIFDNQAYDLRNGFASTDYERLVTNVATDIVDVTDDDYILNLVTNKQSIDLETAWNILEAHDFSLAKIPQLRQVTTLLSYLLKTTISGKEVSQRQSFLTNI